MIGWFGNCSANVMKIAVAAHEGRVSPVLDVARRVLIVEWEGDREIGRHEAALVDEGLSARATALAALHVDVLICGALSQPLEAALTSAGVPLMPRICGSVEEVLAAHRAGRLSDVAFGMPGCCGRRRQQGGCDGGRRRGRGRTGRETLPPKGWRDS